MSTKQGSGPTHVDLFVVLLRLSSIRPLGVVAANASMIRRFLGRVERDEKTPPPRVRDPHPPRDPELAGAHPNAPPAQHVA